MNQNVPYYRLLAAAAAVTIAVFAASKIFTAASMRSGVVTSNTEIPHITLPLSPDSGHSVSLSAGLARSLPVREDAAVVMNPQQATPSPVPVDVPSAPTPSNLNGSEKGAGGVAVSASAAIIKNSAGVVMWGKEPSRRWPLASVTKLMTVSVAASQLPMDLVVRIDDKKLGLSLNGDSHRVIANGEMYSVRDLIAFALLPSNNEAADALAGAVGRERFVELMNQKAAAWGLADTHFEEPTGLSVLNQSTPADVASLLFHIKTESPTLMELSADGRFTVREQTSGRTIDLVSIHKYAHTSSFLGGKTGFTNDAKGNLASLFSLSGNTVAIVVMGSDNREGDTATLLSYARQTR
jgi:D-alanyl-D-alanine endopeptidase (penicillin-binding protein 7)